MSSALDSLRDELAALERAGLRRRLRAIEGAQAAEVLVDGRRAINFCSNNYLGLADHPALAAAATAAMAHEGFGAGASRLIVGNLGAHRSLERALADWRGTPRALLFNSGYQANVGAIAALAGADDAIYSDALNHASLIDGCRLSRAHVEVYRHVDLDDLEARLRRGARARRRVVLTDSLFSMDGDTAPIAALAALAHRHDALLYVDDAHAVGVLGDGAGLAAGPEVDVQMGTLGKALGGFGAYVAGAEPIVELCLQRARAFVFTTALPSPVAAAAEAALALVRGPEGADRRRHLAENVARFHAGLATLGLAPPHRSHIVPILVGAPERAMAVSAQLLERGIFAQGIRPPTVPPDTSRLRFTLMATHTEEHIARALDALTALRPLLPGG